MEEDDDRAILIEIPEDEENDSDVLGGVNAGAVAGDNQDQNQQNDRDIENAAPRTQEKSSCFWFLECKFPPGPWCFPYFIVITTLVQVVYYFGCYLFEKNPDDFWKYNNDCKAVAGGRWDCDHSYFIFVPAWKNLIWRFWTYQFIHGFPAHVLGNAVEQLLYGVCLEMWLGTRRIALIYTAAIVATPLLACALGDPNGIAGSSGGGFALMTALIAYLLVKWNELELGHKMFLLPHAFISVIMTYSDLSNWGPYGTVHLAGIITGFCLGIAIINHKRSRFLRYGFLSGYAIFFVYITIGTVLFHVEEENSRGIPVQFVDIMHLLH